MVDLYSIFNFCFTSVSVKLSKVNASECSKVCVELSLVLARDKVVTSG